MNPGLKIRLAQGLTYMVKENMLQYGLAYLNYDWHQEKTGMIEFDYFPFFIDFYYDNLKHDPIQIDMSTFMFNFTHMAVDEQQVVYLNMPFIEDWSYTFNYAFSFLGFPFKGVMNLEFANISMLGTVAMHATDRGLAYPQIHDIVMDFGDS